MTANFHNQHFENGFPIGDDGRGNMRRRGRLSARWQRGVDGRLECRWHRRSAHF